MADYLYIFIYPRTSQELLSDVDCVYSIKFVKVQQKTLLGISTVELTLQLVMCEDGQ